jgi:hypothetical protein
VDVYAFGIIMWELFTGQRPYGNMRQQKVVEEVVLRGLRPRFPAGEPAGGFCSATLPSPGGPPLYPCPCSPCGPCCSLPPSPPPPFPSRPAHPPGTPPAYASLAASCWSSTPASRPTFNEVITGLQVRVGGRGTHVRQARAQDAWRRVPVHVDNTLTTPSAPAPSCRQQWV